MKFFTSRLRKCLLTEKFNSWKFFVVKLGILKKVMPVSLFHECFVSKPFMQHSNTASRLPLKNRDSKATEIVCSFLRDLIALQVSF